MKQSAESLRLAAANTDTEPWRKWGPYLSERQWGTVREDYSAHGSAWEYFPHDHARSRAYRWGEDGLAGLSDDQQRLCLSVALWNGRDPILKERLFGLTNSEGNHGEDVKELYYYLDATPTHSYLKMLYKYPQREFPYARLVEENARRKGDPNQPEFELLDTGIFDDDRYWDVFVEYAKAGPEDILMQVTAHNRGPDEATVHILPQLWFRNTWSWKHGAGKPQIRATDAGAIRAEYPELGAYELRCEGQAEFLFCDNETNCRRLFGQHERQGHFKDAFHEYLIEGNRGAVNPQQTGTKAAAHYRLSVPAGGSACIKVRLGKLSPLTPALSPLRGEGDATSDRVDSNDRRRASALNASARGVHAASAQAGSSATNAEQDVHLAGSAVRAPSPLNGERVGVRGEPVQACSHAGYAFSDFDSILAQRRREADAFYAELQRDMTDPDARLVQRQAFAGMIWSKQFFYYDVPEWLRGDPAQPPPPSGRKHGRNAEWIHLNNADLISMPDKWEYPWYAAWDLAFHCIPLALVDAEFAKSQLVLLTREWYMHPNGQLPAYEWAFGDVNPPVHAWATWRVFQMDRKQRRAANPEDPGDLAFLERVFHKLMLNFTWWVNRKDAQGRNIFQGGFLGLDNIGVFDRSAPLPTGGFINQADGTSWMAMYSLNLMRIALELARHNHVYEDIATKFFEHFLGIAAAINGVENGALGLWDEQDEFYYDHLQAADGRNVPMKLRSMVGLIPLFAVEVLDPCFYRELPDFAARLEWFLNYRPDLAKLVSRWHEGGVGERHLLSLLRGHRVKCLLRRMLDETEFLSPFGVRALSKVHEREPYRFDAGGMTHEVPYWPAESRHGLFGGNSNWRGPIWMPVNYLLIEALQKFHHYYGDEFKVECPTGSGQFITMNEVANELSRRLSRLFLKGEDGQRPVLKYHPKLASDPCFKDYVLFHEYFHGDTGRGVGASHQTGWTGLVAKLMQPRRRHDLTGSAKPTTVKAKAPRPCPAAPVPRGSA